MFCIIALSITSSCERDDICAEATVTTPALFVEFRDIDNNDELKAVRELRVIAIDDMGNDVDTLLLDSANPSSMLLPLRIEEDNPENIITTSYKLEKNSDFVDNDDDTTTSIIDILEITYNSEFVYVSRACGYKSIFQLIPQTGALILSDDNEDWAINAEIVNELIDNENEAQVYIYH